MMGPINRPLAHGRAPSMRILAALVACALTLGIAPRPAGAFGDTARLVVAQIQYEGDWDPRPTGWRRLAWEVTKRTSIEMGLDRHPLRLADPDLYRYPFLYLAGRSAFSEFPEADVAALRRYLTNGGFLLVDAAEPDPGFDQSVRRLATRLFPDKPLAKIRPEHVVYKSFYLVGRQGGRTLSRAYMEGIETDGRLVLVYTQNDLAGAWARDNFGNWEFEVVPGGSSQREMAFRLGINLAMYALCLDYKEDQVHVPFILKRRKP